MSLQPSQSSAGGGEPLKIWNCVGCRRRKVRCDRHHPCAPCTRNRIECVFPVSGRIPSRSRVGDHAAQKQRELVGRLRRLEAMVGGLGSQVENAVAVSQDNWPMEDTSSLTSTISSGHNSDIAKGTSEPSQDSEDFGVLEVASNGDLVVGEGFWTVFCKEVGILSSPWFVSSTRSTKIVVTVSLLQTADLCIRWKTSLKLSKGTPLCNLTMAAAQRCPMSRIPAITTFFSEVPRLYVSRRRYILFHHRCYFFGKYTWITSILSSKSYTCQPLRDIFEKLEAAMILSG
jgi:Fungal Zn(2)-Cys(6) binuclear cluster domain